MKRIVLLLSALIILCCTPKKEATEDSAQVEVVKNAQPEVKEQNEDTSFDINSFQSLVETYEDPARSDWQNPSLVVDKLGDVKGKVIADIGAGTGYFTFRLAEQGAHVIAIDIEERFLNYIEDRKPELQHIIPDERIETRLSLENDPLLLKQEVDAAIMVNTYHFISNRVDYLKKVKEGLKNNGQVVIVDYKLGQMPVGPPENMKITYEQVIKELKQAGFTSTETDKTSLEFQYIVSARKD